MIEVDPEALTQMKERLRPNTRWAAYQNKLIEAGVDPNDVRFLHVGEGCTFTEAPNRYPDTHLGTGWRHIFIGFVNLDTGEIEPPLGETHDDQ